MSINLTFLNITELPNDLAESEGDFFCSNNRLTTLIGSPKTLSGCFVCSENLLTDLAGGPEYVKLSFKCSNNHLMTLKGCPKFVGNNFWCGFNFNLTDVSDIWDSEIADEIILELNENMAVLPLIKFSTFLLGHDDKLGSILRRNKGSSKQNISNFQFDLIENGFEEHARWKPV